MGSLQYHIIALSSLACLPLLNILKIFLRLLSSLHLDIIFNLEIWNNTHCY